VEPRVKRLVAYRPTADGLTPYELELDGDRLHDATESGGSATPTHWVLHGPLNLHTHVGDAFLTGQVPEAPLEDLVAPPDGFKHRRLASTDPAEIEHAVRRVLAEYETNGWRGIVDFREGGLAGVRILERAAAHGDGLAAVVLGRPVGPDDDLDALLKATHGFAVSSVDQTAMPDLGQLAALAHRSGKAFATHASEGRRDPIDDVLSLEPDLLVHLCKATRADVRRVADADVLVAVCPVSNARFGLRPPIPALEHAGAAWAFGTDNAMFGSRAPRSEVLQALDWFPDLGPRAIARALEAPGAEERLGVEAKAARSHLLVPADRRGRPLWEGPWSVVSSEADKSPPRIPSAWR
jgi:cytosine/adenosine deaminase-related metal-dependent hydrolase